MRTLEARFHPLDRETATFVVVGRLVWDEGAYDRPPRIEPSKSLARQTAPATILATVRHLAVMTSPRSFERLLALRSRFWSFVEVRAPSQPATEVA